MPVDPERDPQGPMSDTTATPMSLDEAWRQQAWHLRIEAAVKAERERCAKIAEEWYLRLDGFGFEKNQDVRRKAGSAIAARIRSGE